LLGLLLHGLREIATLLTSSTAKAFGGARPPTVPSAPRGDALALHQSLAVIRLDGWIEDFHLQAVVHTRHTQKKPRIAPGLALLFE
jgi:hypothetical protein